MFMFCPARATALGLRVRPACSAAHYDKYADKLHEKARQRGVDLDELKSQARAEDARRRQKAAAHVKPPPSVAKGAQTTSVRRDSSPVKPLDAILNVPKLLATPHTSSQLSTLWTAYHASRSNGTGRGYISASLSLDSYNAMVRVAKKYPVFVIPVQRQSAPDTSADGGAATAHEFFFLQWDFYPGPPAPSATEPNPFDSLPSDGPRRMPETSTVLFTPLQEYKHRASFATPYLVLTFYTDMSRSHGIVLLRGEITPSAAAHPEQKVPERFLLNQVDAQMLAMGLQRFYLWGNDEKGGKTAEVILKQFHEEPQTFSWQDLVKFTSVVA